MEILWLGNVILPQIAKQLNLNNSVVGGWLSGASKPILDDKTNRLIYLFPYTSNDLEGQINNLAYVGFVEYNIYKFDNDLKTHYVSILKKYKPDIIHIWGTEYAHSLAMVIAAEECHCIDKVLVSIQGLTSVYAHHYCVGLSKHVQRAKTLRDIIRKDNIINQQKQFYIRGENEIKTLTIAKNIIGRTQWDKESCLYINPNLKYYFCNESLREDFYDKYIWSYDKCEKHTIFCAQGNYPIKGLHFAIKALAILRKQYPDIILKVTGEDIVNKSFLQRQKKTYYFSYLRKLIKKYKLEDNIQFLGSLDADKMIGQYSKANVFLSPSTIENSSNAIGEAMMIGLPVVASNVGGTPTMLEDNTGLLYKVDDTNELANNIIKIFENKDFATELSQNAYQKAKKRHDYLNNNNCLLDIYKNLMQGK